MSSRRREQFSHSQAVIDLVYTRIFDGVESPWGSRHDVMEFNPRSIITEDTIGMRHKDNNFRMEARSHKPTQGYISANRKLEGGLEGPGDTLLYEYRRTRGVISDVQHYNFFDLVGPDEGDDAFVTRACAGTNPSKAEFDAAVFAAELRDVPRLLQLAGSQMSKFGANEYLKYQYGWKPLVRDIKNLMSATEHLQKRLAQVERLGKGLTIKRRWDKQQPERLSGEEVTNFDLANGVDIKHVWHAQLRRWVVVKWIPELPDDLTTRLAPLVRDMTPVQNLKRAMLGGNIDGHTLWQVMPWSWLLDWTANASDYLQSKQNIVGAKVGDTCLMKELYYDSLSHFQPGPIPPDQDDQYSLSVTSVGGAQLVVRKERIVGIKPSIVHANSLNLISGSGFKQSILGALAIQRLRRLPF